MANGIGGLLGRIGSGIQGLLGNPLVQGVGMAAAAGANPLLGLLAAPAIQSSRERKAAELELLRQGVRRGQRQEEAQEQLQGLLGRREFVESPVGLLNLEGSVDVLPAQRSVPAVQTPEGQQEVLGILGQLAPAQVAAQLLPQPAEPTTLERNLRIAGIDPRSDLGRSIVLQNLLPKPSGTEVKFDLFRSALGREPTQDEVLKFFGSGGTTINIGENQATKPIPASELTRIRLPSGDPLPLGTTYGEAQEAGAKVFSASELERKQKLTDALGVVADLKSLAVGEEGVFVGIPRNVIGRAAEAAMNVFGDLAGTKASINRSLYRSMSQGTLAPLVRSLGESGALAEGDVARAIQLLADLDGVPESEAVARRKFAQLEEIFKRGLAAFESDAGPSTVTTSTGVTVEFID